MTRWLDSLVRTIGDIKAQHGRTALIVLAVVLATIAIIVRLT